MQTIQRRELEEDLPSLPASFLPYLLTRVFRDAFSPIVTMEKKQWTTLMVLGAATVSIAAVVMATALSVCAVFGLKALFLGIINLLKLVTEIATALIAALTSGSTISLSVISAVWASALTVPASHIEMRVIVAVCVASLSLLASALVLVISGVIGAEREMTYAVTCAAAVAVSVAAGWAVGILSLMEKETQQIGIGMTSIFDAVKNNNFIILRLLLSFHRDVRKKEMDRALLHSVKANYHECSRALLANGADPDARDAHGNTALLNAAQNGFYKIMKSLLDAGCRVDERSEGRGTALHHAAKWGHVQCCELLLARGADLDARDGFWRTPLILAARDAADAQAVMQALVEAKCDVNLVGVEKKSALHYACARGLEVSFLLNAKADMHSCDEDGNTPMHLAALSGHAHCLMDLFSRGCDPNVSNIFQRTPLHMACMKNNFDCTSVLVGYGADVNRVDNDGRSPVWYSTVNGHSPAVGKLLRANASLKTQYTSLSEDSLLRLALDRGYYPTAKYLILFGVKTKALDQWLNSQLQVPFTDPSLKDAFDWLKSYTNAPPTLCHTCRLCIRQSVVAKPYWVIFRLPLPTALLDYMNYSELNLDT